MKGRFGFVYLRDLAGIGIVIALVLLFILSLLGEHPTAVFSTVNSGLSEGYVVGNLSATAQAVPAGGGYPLPAAGGAASISAPTGGGYPLPSGAGPAAQADLERLVIKNAALRLEVQDVAQSEAIVSRRAGELGGYLLESSTNGTGPQLSARIVFRVPVERFNEALASVESLASKLLVRSLHGSDTTEEFVDLESRLRNLEQTRDRLRDFLNQTSKVADALAVNGSLTEVQGQIEQIQGRMRYIRQSAALSTITVELLPIPPPPPPVVEVGWQPMATAEASLRDLIAVGQWGVERLIIAVIWLPIWGPLAALAWWAARRVRWSPTARAAE